MTERDTTDLQRRAAVLLDPCCRLDAAAWIDNAEELIRDLLAALSARETPPQTDHPRSSALLRHWQEEDKLSPEPYALEQRLRALTRAIVLRLRGPVHPEMNGRKPEIGEHHTTINRDMLADMGLALGQAADAIAALTQAKADAEARCVELEREKRNWTPSPLPSSRPDRRAKLTR